MSWRCLSLLSLCLSCGLSFPDTYLVARIPSLPEGGDSQGQEHKCCDLMTNLLLSRGSYTTSLYGMSYAY